MKKIIKKAGCIILLLFLIIALSNVIGAPIVFNILFDRYDSPDYNIMPGIANYEEIKDLYPRSNVEFESKGNTLAGYYYEVEDNKATVVMSHGIHDGADSLLNEAIYFINNGYSVFSYDNSGCSNSEGKVNGFTQSLIDLESALKYLNKDNDDKLLLFGFSWGGFATASILNLDIENIYGSVSISGYDDSKTLVASKGEAYVGPLVYTGQGVVSTIQRSRFGNYVEYTAVEGINNTNIPVFIAHGENDTVIRYEKESILSKRDNIINPNVEYFIGKNENHTSILYSDAAIKYQQEVDNKLNKIRAYDDKLEYLATVDDYKYSQLNEELFIAILNFYNKCLD